MKLNVASLAALLLVLVTITSLYEQRDAIINPVLPGDELTPEELALPLKESALRLRSPYVTTQKSLTITLHNDFNTTIWFGRKWELYKLGDDGAWKLFPNIYPFYLDITGIPPGHDYPWTANITGLTSGRYKVTKAITFTLPGDPTWHSTLLETEFIVIRPTADPNRAPVYGYDLLTYSIWNDPNPPKLGGLNLRNYGGLNLTFTPEYHLYLSENGNWVEIESRAGDGPLRVVPPGEYYPERFGIKLPAGTIRYVKPVLVEGFNQPVQFSFEIRFR